MYIIKDKDFFLSLSLSLLSPFLSLFLPPIAKSVSYRKIEFS